MSDPVMRAYVLDGRGGGAAVGWSEVCAWASDGGVLWAHLDRTHEAVRAWVAGEFEHEAVAGGLLAEDTRPGVEVVEGRLVFNLRGVNLNPGAEAEDMLTIRGWAEGGRVVTLAKYRLLTVEGMAGALESGSGAGCVGELLREIARGLTERMAPVLGEIEETIGELEERVVDPERTVSRAELVDARRRIISLHRFLGPQARAVGALGEVPFEALGEDDRRAVRVVANDVTRMVEDLEAARARSAVIQDELSNQLAERLNRRMYVLTLVAGIILPLSLVTGLFGMNVGGLPLQGGWGFAFLTGALALVGVLGVWAARRGRWI